MADSQARMNRDMKMPPSCMSGYVTNIWRWLSDDRLNPQTQVENGEQIDWVRCIPFALLHLACLGVIWVGFSWAALVVAAVLYTTRMFFVTAFYQ